MARYYEKSMLPMRKFADVSESLGVNGTYQSAVAEFTCTILVDMDAGGRLQC